MPRDGSLILSDVREPTLAVVCEACGRRGRYRMERLMAEHGDAKLTDLLRTLVHCPKARSARASLHFILLPMEAALASGTKFPVAAAVAHAGFAQLFFVHAGGA
jgi:hypothetical protein